MHNSYLICSDILACMLLHESGRVPSKALPPKSILVACNQKPLKLIDSKKMAGTTRCYVDWRSLYSIVEWHMTTGPLLSKLLM